MQNIFLLLFFCFTGESLWGAWSMPNTLSPIGVKAQAPDVAIDPSGNSTAVWMCQDPNSDVEIIQSSSHIFSKTWSQVQNISKNDTSDALDPEVQVDSYGNVVAIWEDSDGKIMGASCPLSGNWTNPIQISSSRVNASDPKLAMDASGNAVCVWIANEANQSVQASFLCGCTSWSVPTTLSGDTEDAADADVLFDPFGKAMAIWSRFDGKHSIIQSATCMPNQNWTQPLNVSTPGNNASNPHLALAGKNLVVAIWEQSNATHNSIQAASSLLEGGWSTPLKLSVDGCDAHLSVNPIASAKNTTIAIWSSFNGTNTVAQVAFFHFGNWTTAQDISQANHNIKDPQIGLDTHANGLALWSTRNGSNQVVQAACFSSGMWKPAVTLSPVHEDSRDPQLHVSQTGPAIAIWENDTTDTIQTSLWTNDEKQ